MVLENAVSVHLIIKVATESLQFVGSIVIWLNLAFVECIWFFEVDPSNIAALIKILTILYLCYFFDCFYPEVGVSQRCLQLLLSKPRFEVNPFPLIERLLEENPLITLVKYFKRRPIQELLHDISFVLLLENVFVDTPVLKLYLEHLVVLLLLLV